MKKMTRSSPSLLSQDQEDSSLEDYEETFLDLAEVPSINQMATSSPSARSTPCLLESSRPPSSIEAVCDWGEEPWLSSMANSDSCLVGSSAGASPLTATSSQGVSPTDANDQRFLFHSSELGRTSMDDALKIEKDFMEYVMCFPLDAPLSSTEKKTGRGLTEPKKASTDGSPKVGLDHLDNLCKLMEQLSDLKENNVKLKKRVQYLEDLKTLHEIHREMFGVATLCNSCVSDEEFKKISKPKVSPIRGLSEENCPDMLMASNEARELTPGLYRSKTTTHVDSRTDNKAGHRSRHSDLSGIEKTRERSKSVGHPGHSKCKKRPSRWSKVKEVLGIEKQDSSAAECPELTPEVDYDDDQEDFVKRGLEECYRSEAHCKNHKEQNLRQQRANILSSKSFSSMPSANMDDKIGSKKGVKTPWSRMKTMIQSRRDLRNPKSESSSGSSRTGVQEKTPNEGPEQSSNGNRRNIRSSRKSSFTLQDLPKKHQSRDAKTNLQDNVGPWNSQKKAKPTTHEEVAHPSHHQQKRQNSVTDNCRHAKAEGSCGNSRTSLEKEDKPKRRPPPLKGNLVADSNLDSTSICESKTSPKDREQRTSTDSNPSPCASTTVTDLLKELQQNLSEDFNRKLEEWQKYRHDGSKVPNLEVERKDSFGRFRKFSKPEKKATSSEKHVKQNVVPLKKDMNCLEKELQKMEREILRLSKEKEKFSQRLTRLKHLKGMTEKTNEVLVKTSAGEFRFQGISDEFTRKLYEWETKKGVGPELSTIALLDESLNPQDQDTRDCRSNPCIDTIGTTSFAADQLEKPIFQKSKSCSEPDLYAMTISQKENSVGPLPTMRSKSGDTLLATSNDSNICSQTKEDNCRNESQVTVVKITTKDSSREDYCSLLEENMFLLDQLKDKEDICSRLQNELDRLDERSEKANRAHQEEMEKYREKLWEIHMSRPRDLQGSLQLISELKMRIEELQKCGDKLKSDREKLETSFKYHSEQQSRLANDLIRRMTELHESGFTTVFNRSGASRRKWRKVMKCDAGSISRIQELSTVLLQQAREMEEALAERTKQVCHLRWELLHRDMSAVLMQAALHRVTCQGPQTTLLPTWDMKRIKFKEFKAWSIDTTTRRQSEDTRAEDWLQDRLKQLSLTPYKEWTSIEFNPNDLMGTVHELKKEAIRMSSCRLGRMTDSEERKKTTSCSAESEMADSDRNYDTGSAFNSRSSSFSSGLGAGLRGSHSDTRIYERARSSSVRRNSSSSMSCVSGFDASESSSMHDSDRNPHFMRRGCSSTGRRKNQWPSRENVSSSGSSRSSGLEDDASQWTRVYHNEESPVYDDTLSRQMQLKYCSLREADEENADSCDYPKSSWASKCLITPRPLQLNALSDENHVQRSTESSYSFLRALIPHPSYISTTTSGQKITSEASKIEEPLASASPKTQYSEVPISVQNTVYSYPSTSNDRIPSKESGSYLNSSTYTSAESLDNCKYITHNEQKLFSDIRSLAQSCIPSKNQTEDTQETDARALEYAKPSEISSSRNKSPDITQFKYKGTKGFGKSSKFDFMKQDTEKGSER